MKSSNGKNDLQRLYLGVDIGGTKVACGIVGDDGPTHHGVFDIAFLRCIPNMTIFSPMDEHELRHIISTTKDIEPVTAYFS